MIACKNCGTVIGGAARGTAECQMIDRTRRIEKYGLESEDAGQGIADWQTIGRTPRTRTPEREWGIVVLPEGLRTAEPPFTLVTLVQRRVSGGI